MADFRLTVLVENTAGRSDLAAEHGWSVAIECEGGLALFDTGQTDVVTGNAKALGIDLGRLSWIVLSHGHYDHTGGLRSVLEVAKSTTVFAHPEAFLPKFVKGDSGEWRDAGMPISWEEMVKRDATPHVERGRVSVAERVTATGEISRSTSFETVHEHFFVDRDGRRVIDRFLDDQALVLDTDSGPVVVVGCSHAGVVNTLRHVADMTGKDRIHAVIGGMHLGAATEECLAQTIHAFGEYGVERIGLAHCTGEKAVREFASAFGSRCFPCPVGTVVEFSV
jgi:7,8-dihydropterin-6-yl-methyl-4-(beta-D-ribofuranosyl)aminobenzene 5'-phosphate synthase